MEMSERSVRDGVILVSAYYYFLSLTCLIGVIAILIFGIIPSENWGNPNSTNKLFLPILGSLIGLILFWALLYTAIGTARYRNRSRIMAIFLSAMGLMSGFVMVMGSLLITLTNATVPDWVAMSMIGIILVCLYALFAFMDLFILIFLFNRRVREAFYINEAVSE